MRAWPCLLLTFACAPETERERVELGPPGDAYAESEIRIPPPRPDVPEDAPRVVFLGDSIAAGLHLDPGWAFPAVTQRLLFDDGVAFHCSNAGVSGDTSAGGRARIDWILSQEPDVVVVELGGNDGLRGVELASTEANLRAILEAIEASGSQALLLGMRVPPSLGADYSEGFAAIYPRLAGELDVPLVPFFMEGVGGVPELNLPDGLHPNVEGHAALARNVAPALREVLEGLPE